MTPSKRMRLAPFINLKRLMILLMTLNLHWHGFHIYKKVLWKTRVWFVKACSKLYGIYQPACLLHLGHTEAYLGQSNFKNAGPYVVIRPQMSGPAPPIRSIGPGRTSLSMRCTDLLASVWRNFLSFKPGLPKGPSHISRTGGTKWAGPGSTRSGTAHEQP